MRVLVTGGLGGIGRYISKELLASEIDLSILAYKNKKYARWFSRETIIWGDISKLESYQQVLEKVEAVIHTAFMLYPKSETHPLAETINVDGTKTLVKALEKCNPNCRFVFTSSGSVYGPTAHKEPPITVNTPLNPTDKYSKHKAACEKIIAESTLDWSILRLPMVPYMELALSGENMDAIFTCPADQRIEGMHVRDVAIACKNALTTDCVGKTLLLGGGKSWQITYYQLISRLFKLFHLKPPPIEKFPKEPTYGDWYDSKQSQEILSYQRYSFEDYLEDLRKELGIRRRFLLLVSPLANFYMNRRYSKE